MGLVVGCAKPQPALEPFLSWDADTLGRFLDAMRKHTAMSVRLSKWQILEFVGMERLAEVAALFALFEDPADTCINGLQLACALLLCNAGNELEPRVQTCLQLFDWNGSGSFAESDLMMLFCCCTSAFSRCLAPPPDALPAKNSLRELCRRAMPNGGQLSCDELARWIMEEKDVRTPLEHLAPVPLSVPEEPIKLQSEVQYDDIIKAGQAEAQQVRVPDPTPDPLLDPVPNAVPDPVPDLDPDPVLDPVPNPVPDPLRCPLPGIDATRWTHVDAAERFIEEAAVALKDRMVQEEQQPLMGLTGPTHTLGTTGMPSKTAAESREIPWLFAQGFLLPLAHGAEANISQIPTDARLVALRHRVWLRRSNLGEELRHGIATASLALTAELGSPEARQARADAAEELGALVEAAGEGDNIESLCKALKQCLATAETRQLDVLSEWRELLPLAQLKCDVERLEGAVAFLEFAGKQGQAGFVADVVRLRSDARSLKEELMSEYEEQKMGLPGPGRPRLKELLAAKVLAQAATAALEATGEELAVLQEQCKALKGAAAAGNEAASAALYSAWEAKKHRWRRCEGALVAQRALARSEGLRFELRMHRARQMRGGAHKGALFTAMGAVAPQPPKNPARVGASTTRRILETLFNVFESITQGNDNQRSLEDAIPKAQELAFAASGGEGVLDDSGQKSRTLDNLDASMVGEGVKAFSQQAEATEQASLDNAWAVGPGANDIASREKEEDNSASSHQSPSSKSPKSPRSPRSPMSPSSSQRQITAAAESEALAHLRNFRFEQRAHEAAVATARELKEEQLAERLEADLETSTSLLSAVEQSLAFRDRSAKKWRRAVKALLKELSGKCSTVEGALSMIRHKLCMLQSALLGFHDNAGAVEGTARVAALPLPFAADSEDAWGMVGAPCSCALVARHAQAAKVVGNLWALELVREGAGSPTADPAEFACLKRCVRLQVEARFLEASAEQRMVEAELTMTPDSENPHDKETPEYPANGALVATAEALFRDCWRVDLEHLLQSWEADPHLETKADVFAWLKEGLTSGATALGMEDLPAPGPPPSVPAISSWWRTSGNGTTHASEAMGAQDDAPFDGLACRRCLALSKMMCESCDSKQQLEKHAIALRVWLWARAQRAVAVTLLRGHSPNYLTRTLRHILELCWRRELRRQALTEHASARVAALKAAASFIASLPPKDIESLDREDLEVHLQEVNQSMDRAIEEDLDDLFQMFATNLGQDAYTNVEQGFQACLASFHEAAQGVAGPGLGEVVRPLACASKLPCGQQEIKERTDFDHYIAQLSGTRHALELLRDTCPSAC